MVRVGLCPVCGASGSDRCSVAHEEDRHRYQCVRVYLCNGFYRASARSMVSSDLI